MDSELEVDEHTSNTAGMVINSDNSSQEGATTGHLGVVGIHMQAEARNTNQGNNRTGLRGIGDRRHILRVGVWGISVLNAPPSGKVHTWLMRTELQLRMMIQCSS